MVKEKKRVNNRNKVKAKKSKKRGAKKVNNPFIIKDKLNLPKVEEVTKAEEPKDDIKVEEVKPNKTAKQTILEQYGGLESNVPINSGYWNMK